MKLTSKQRKQLESMAISLDTVVRIGKHGVTPNLVQSLQQALTSHELVKVKILDNAGLEADEVAKDILGKTKCMLVRTIGRVLVLFQPKPKTEKKRIELVSDAKEPREDSMGVSHKTTTGPVVLRLKSEPKNHGPARKKGPAPKPRRKYIKPRKG